VAAIALMEGMTGLRQVDIKLCAAASMLSELSQDFNQIFWLMKDSV
jgi:hypothetical protein